MADERQMAMATKKLKALKGGLVSDVVFLVGATDATAQEIHAFRSDLVVSSEFFVSLLDSPLTLKRDGKIRLKNIEPKVFELVIEFTHLCGHLVSEVDSLDCCLQLAAAADEYMIYELGSECSKLLEDNFLTVDNVWTVLSQHYMVEAVSSVCLKILGSKTSVCLKQASFLEASEETVKLFCNLDKMSIESESELLSACLKYIKTKRNQRELFRQCCLPGLRLLTLDSADLAKVFPMLTREEKTSVLISTSPLIGAKKPQLAPGLCPISIGRSLITEMLSQQTLNLVHDSHILGVREVFLTGAYVACSNNFYEQNASGGGRCWVSLALSPKRRIRITGFELVNILDLNKEVFANSAKRKPCGRVTEITATVDNQQKSLSSLLSEDVTLPENFPLNGCTLINHSALVPAGGSFTLKVFFKDGCVVRTQRSTEHQVKRINSSAAFDVFSKIEISQNLRISNHLKKKCPAHTKLCFFKSIQFTDI
ncbi:uncharacterized protein LOC135943377 [Cloeon dipterum]|uniref:uncharacterized protein LOC135943377 n=1 Tax=Cloeon dipterum TaxID=197152 RepID=UPI00321F6B7C